MKDKRKYHLPVMVDEVLDAFGFLDNAPLNKSDINKKIVDATLGTAGHTLEFISRGAYVLGIEWDEYIYKLAKKRLIEACPASEYSRMPYRLVNASFEKIDTICKENDFLDCDGVLMDLGVNSLHLDLKRKGFSFTDSESSLDMRFNPNERAISASTLLNLLDKKSLIRLFAEYVDFRDARNLALEISKKRKEKAFETVSDFNETINRVIKRKGKLSPETLPFMALRIAVNTELENIQNSLPKALSVLKVGGILAVISFHSGEDKLVKNSFKRMSEEGEGEIITIRPKKPKISELKKNPRSRSARLRYLKKLK